MKNRLSVKVLALALCIAALYASNASAQSPYGPRPQYNIRAYSGLSITPYFTTNFTDAHITQSSPALGPIGPNESRVAAPLSQGASEGIRLGGMLGFELMNLGNNKDLSMLLEFQGMPGERSRYWNIMGGFAYKFYEFKDVPIKLGAMLKGGYAFGLASLATVEGVPGRPIQAANTADGPFYAGDKIEANLNAGTFQIVLTGNYNFPTLKNLDIGLQLGYQAAWINPITAISSSGTLFDPASPNVVRPDLTRAGSTPAFTGGLPSVSMNGFFGLLQIGYVIY
jgi:hypothetical protein